MNSYQQQVLNCLKDILDNAMLLPDENCQFPGTLGNSLGEAISRLSQWEDETFGTDNLALRKQLRQEIASESERKIEAVMDAADKLFVSIFHQVIVPGAIYRVIPSAEIDYCPQSEIENAKKAIEDYYA